MVCFIASSHKIWISRHVTTWRLYSGAYISDQESGKEFVWTEYTVTSCHSIQIRPMNRPNRWRIQQYNMYCNANIDDRMYCQRKLKGDTNISICQLTMGKENISQKKNVIRNIHFLYFLQHTNKTCRNQRMGQWTRWNYNLRPAYGLVRWQRLSHFHKLIFKIHSWHNLHITNI